MKNSLLLYLFLTVLMLAGCGGKAGLSGKVTYPDGSPLGTGTVYFETDTYMARGELKTDGTFVVGSLSEKDGIPAGKYRVSISGAVKEIGRDKISGLPVTEPLIDLKFTRGSTSGLTVDVPVPGGKFDIQVEPYIAKK